MTGDDRRPLIRDLTIINKRGLHARASAKFVQTAEKFDAYVTVLKDGHSIGAGSIMGLMMLAAGPGTTIRVVASGPEAEAVLDALDHLVSTHFGEEE